MAGKLFLKRLVLTLSSLVFISGVLPSSIFVQRASALGSYNNASIADTALSYVGQKGGQCRAFVTNIVWAVSGHTQPLFTGTGNDYFSQFANAGGVEINNINNLVKGDIVQRYIGPTDLHTVIVVQRVSGSTFQVVDSNYAYDEVVRVHNYDITLSSSMRAFRMGTVISQPATVPAPTVQHAYTVTDSGLIYESLWKPGDQWHNSQVSSFGTSVSHSSSGTDSNNLQHVYGVTSTGQLYEKWWQPGSNGWQGGQIPNVNVGNNTTAMAHQLVSGGAQRIYTGNSAGTIYETWWAPGYNWTSAPLVTLDSSVVSVATTLASDGVQHVYSATSSGNIYETYWIPGSGWNTKNIGSVAGSITGISAQLESSGDQHVYVANNSGDIYELWWAPWDPNVWHSVLAKSLNTPITSITSNILLNGAQRVYAASANNNVYEIWFAPGQQGWQGGNSVGVGDAPLKETSSILMANGTQLVFFSTATGNIYQSWWTSSTGWGSTWVGATSPNLVSLGTGLTF